MEAAIKLMKMSESEWGSGGGGGWGGAAAHPSAARGLANVKICQNRPPHCSGFDIIINCLQLPLALPPVHHRPAWSSHDALRLPAVSARYVFCFSFRRLPAFCLFSSSSCRAFGVFAYFAFELHYLQFSFRFIIHLNGKDWYNVIQDNYLFISYRFFCVLLVLEIFGISDPSRPLRRISRSELGIFGSV